MNREKEIQNILDRNFTRGDNANALKELLDLFNQSLPKEEVGLTEDLLLKLGFTKGNDVYRNAFSKVVLKTDFYLRPSCGGGYYWGFNISDEKNDCELNDVRPIKFVHELQNLLFAITGEQFNQEEK